LPISYFQLIFKKYCRDKGDYRFLEKVRMFVKADLISLNNMLHAYCLFIYTLKQLECYCFKEIGIVPQNTPD